jgi:large subunit ribosomal protein L13Ae
MNISGSLFRNKLKYQHFIRKRTNTNPTRGPWHYRSPSRILWRVIRGMIPHKTDRGVAALERLKVFEGIPHPFDRLKRQVIPAAFRSQRLKPGRKFCKLGDLAHNVGWKHQGLLEKLEEKRKVASSAWYNTKKELNKLKAKALVNVASSLKPVNEALAKLGH